MSTSTTWCPSARNRSTAAANASAQPGASPSSCDGSGTAMRGTAGRSARARSGRASGSTPSGPAISSAAVRARSSDRANTVTQSCERQAGTTPVFGTSPFVGFTPTRLPSAAGTRPDPAVSVPSAKSTMPRATAVAEPLDEPPEIRVGSQAFRTAPNGERVPTRPVANWSRFVLPTTTAPAARSRATAVASAAGSWA